MWRGQRETERRVWRGHREFVKAYPELFAKENARHVDKNRKDALLNELGGQLGRIRAKA